MTVNHDRIKFLLEQYAGNLASEDEVTELFSLVKASQNDEFLKTWLNETIQTVKPAGKYDDEKWNEVLSKILENKTETKVVRMQPKRIWQWVAAACVVGLLVGGYFIIASKTKQSPPAVATTHDVEAPTITKATITLADGRKVTVDSLTSITQRNVTVTKNAEGKIIYQSTANGQQPTIQYNTLTNPRGSKVVNLTLSDGTKVWLNSESSLKYPVAFNGSERKVEITGEAYFEVKHNDKMPFKVVANGAEIEDLGTEFNVNSYEGTKTTLIQGSVAVTLSGVEGSTKRKSITLKPGEQAVVMLSGVEALTTNTNVDIDEVTAWKNGKFQFNDASIETIMKEVSRWYDAEIVYQGKIPGNFVADISRDVPVSKLLHILELTNRVHFKIEGKKVIVMN